MIRILELLLCLILRTLELLSGRPPNRHDDEDDEEDRDDEVTKIINRNKPQEQKPKPSNNRNLTVLSEEVSNLINNIMETNKATQEVDMKEIGRLRSEIARLQQELIIAKTDNSKLRSMMKERQKEGGDAEDG